MICDLHVNSGYRSLVYKDYINIYAYIHTFIHTYICMYVHTYTYIYANTGRRGLVHKNIMARVFPAARA
jgi:hypothetical protein